MAAMEITKELWLVNLSFGIHDSDAGGECCVSSHRKINYFSFVNSPFVNLTYLFTPSTSFKLLVYLCNNRQEIHERKNLNKCMQMNADASTHVHCIEQNKQLTLNNAL